MTTINNKGVGSYKKLTITHQTPREELLGTPLVLPTTKPGSPQVTLTLTNSDLPIFNEFQPFSYTAIPMLFVSGQNSAGAAVTVNFDVYKNGVSIGTATRASIANTNYWAGNFLCGKGIADDVYTVYIWANLAGVTYEYNSLFVYASSVQVAKDKTLLKDFNLKSSRATVTYPVLGANFTNGSLTNWTVYLIGTFASTWAGGAGYAVFPYWQQNSPGYTGSVIANDATFTAVTQANATKRVCNGWSTLSEVNFREMLRW
jgi:hypothetical protein